MTVEIHKRVYDQKLLGSLNLDNEILERMIMSNPDQWIWTHNRWKI